MKPKDRFKAVLCVILMTVVCAFGVFSVNLRVNQCLNIKDATALMAAFVTMPDAKLTSKTEKPKSTQNKPKAQTIETVAKQELKDNSTHIGEKTYPINELNISSGNVEYGNFSVKNSTAYDMDIENLLQAQLGFEFKDTREAQVLIVHTHTCESYMSEDSGLYYESFYPRTANNEENVTAVGKEIADSLKEHGIGVVHATTQHDNPSYDGAYGRSYDTIMSYMNKYKEIKVVLDIHRDSMTAEDMTKLKPTFTYKGEKAAQIMIMAGHDDGDGEFPTWEKNLNFALKLQQTCEDMYEGMTRPLNFGDFTYNMNVNSGSLLIEVGTDANTLEEAKRTGAMLGNALSQVLQKS